jgi:hypothetical protein
MQQLKATKSRLNSTLDNNGKNNIRIQNNQGKCASPEMKNAENAAEALW